MFRKTGRKIIAGLIASLFLMSEGAWAVPSWQVEVAEFARASIQPIIVDPSRLDIPLDSVTLKEVHQGTSGELIIHIQDAHANLSGQKSLSDTLDHLFKKYDLELVMVEGSSRDSSLHEVRNLAPLKDWKIIARRFLFDGVISGEEYLNLTSEHPMKILGVEYRDLYDESLKAYAALVDRREDILHYLYRSRTGLDRLKPKHYPEELLSYEKQKARLTDDGDFKSRLENLLVLTQKARLDLSGFPEIQKLLLIREKEKAVRFEDANREQTRLFEKLQNLNEGEAVQGYLKTQRRLKNAQLSQSVLLGNLLELAKKKGLNLEDFPELASYENYLKGFTGLHAERLFNELELLEDQVFNALLLTDDAKILRALDRFTGLLGQAYKLQMSSKDYKLFEFNEPDFKTESWLAFLNQKLADSGFFESLMPYRPNLDEARGDLERFYNLVGERDRSFVENARRLMKNHKQKAAVLIAGGYHTAHLTELMKQEGISYIVLTPVVTDKTDHAKYEKLLLARLAGHERAIQPEPGAKPFEPQTPTRKIPRGLRIESLIESAVRSPQASRLSKQEYVDPGVLNRTLLEVAASRLSNGDSPGAIQLISPVSGISDPAVAAYLKAHPEQVPKVELFLAFFSDDRAEAAGAFRIKASKPDTLMINPTALPWRPWMADPRQERRFGRSQITHQRGIENRWYKLDDPAIQLQVIDEGFLISEGDDARTGLRNPVYLGRVSRVIRNEAGAVTSIPVPYPVTIKRGISPREGVLAQILSRLKLLDFEGVVRDGDRLDLVIRHAHGKDLSAIETANAMPHDLWLDFAKSFVAVDMGIETPQYLLTIEAGGNAGYFTLIDAANLQRSGAPLSLPWSGLLAAEPGAETDQLAALFDLPTGSGESPNLVSVKWLDSIGERIAQKIVFPSRSGQGENYDYHPILRPAALRLRSLVAALKNERAERAPAADTALVSTEWGRALVHDLEFYSNFMAQVGEEGIEVSGTGLSHEEALAVHGKILYREAEVTRGFLRQIREALEASSVERQNNPPVPVLKILAEDSERLRIAPALRSAISRDATWSELVGLSEADRNRSILPALRNLETFFNDFEGDLRFYRDYAQAARFLAGNEESLKLTLRRAVGAVISRWLNREGVPQRDWSALADRALSEPESAEILPLVRFGMGVIEGYERDRTNGAPAGPLWPNGEIWGHEEKIRRFAVKSYLGNPGWTEANQTFASFLSSILLLRNRLREFELGSGDQADSPERRVLWQKIKDALGYSRIPSASKLAASSDLSRWIASHPFETEGDNPFVYRLARSSGNTPAFPPETLKLSEEKPDLSPEEMEALTRFLNGISSIRPLWGEPLLVRLGIRKNASLTFPSGGDAAVSYPWLAGVSLNSPALRSPPSFPRTSSWETLARLFVQRIRSRGAAGVEAPPGIRIWYAPAAMRGWQNPQGVVGAFDRALKAQNLDVKTEVKSFSPTDRDPRYRHVVVVPVDWLQKNPQEIPQGVTVIGVEPTDGEATFNPALLSGLGILLALSNPEDFASRADRLRFDERTQKLQSQLNIDLAVDDIPALHQFDGSDRSVQAVVRSRIPRGLTFRDALREAELFQDAIAVMA